MFLELGLPEIRNWAMHYDLKRGKKYNFRNPKILTFFQSKKIAFFIVLNFFFWCKNGFFAIFEICSIKCVFVLLKKCQKS